VEEINMLRNVNVYLGDGKPGDDHPVILWKPANLMIDRYSFCLSQWLIHDASSGETLRYEERKIRIHEKDLWLLGSINQTQMIYYIRRNGQGYDSILVIWLSASRMGHLWINARILAPSRFISVGGSSPSTRGGADVICIMQGLRVNLVLPVLQ